MLKMDLGSLLVLIYTGFSILIMLFAVVRHHWHRHKLRRTPLHAMPKRPPASVAIAGKREGIR